MWKGLSGMDAAREPGVPPTMGQGWPFAAGPWNVTGAREPPQPGPDAGASVFGYF